MIVLERDGSISDWFIIENQQHKKCPMSNFYLTEIFCQKIWLILRSLQQED